jgi:protein TonB
MVRCLDRLRHPVLALVLAASSVGIVYDHARGEASGTPATKAPSPYMYRLGGHLLKYRRHPDQGLPVARKGEVLVKFSTDRKGKILGVRVVRSSGSEALDRAALDMIRRASPVPAPPSGTNEFELWLDFSDH